MIPEEQIQEAFRKYREEIGKAPENQSFYTYNGVTYEHFKAGYLAAMSFGEDLL